MLTIRDMNRKLLLLVPAHWAALFDVVITITHQPADYWNGNLSRANEGNPIGAYMMGNHVSGIFVISFVWLVIIGVLGYFLPRKFANVFLLFVLMVHSWGASTWLSQFYGFWYVIVFIASNSVLFYAIQGALRVEKGVLTDELS